MSRSGYSEDFGDDGQSLGLYRASVARAINGKRGQTFLREMAEALDAMPVKELITGEVVSAEGCVCAIGAVAVARKMDVTTLDIHDGDDVGKAFGVARSLACEIAFENDDGFGFKVETPAQRWTRMRAWVGRQLRRSSEEPGAATKETT